MEPFDRIAANAVPLDLANVNTDQIFPARFIKKPRGPGYARFCFHDLRFTDTGAERREFPLNQPRYRNAGILVANTNFGCGSSREGAVYALLDYGFRALIAPSFGDIFAANCLKNGVLALRLPEDTVAELRHELNDADPTTMTVDLVEQCVRRVDGGTLAFSLDPFERECLLRGLKEIDLSLRHVAEIRRFEEQYRGASPWLFSSLDQTP